MGGHRNTRCCGYKTKFKVCGDLETPYKTSVFINIYRAFEHPTPPEVVPAIYGQNVVNFGPNLRRVSQATSSGVRAHSLLSVSS